MAFTAMLGFAHKCLVLLSLAVFCFAIHPDMLNLAPPPGRMRALPTRTHCVWERPEDLRSIDPRTTAVATLDRTIVLGDRITIIPRRQFYAYPVGTRRIAVWAKRLLAFGGAVEYLGSQVVDYANAHPGDPDVPEALYLALGMIRYGCYHEYTRFGHAPDAHAQAPGEIAHEVVSLRRRRYLANPWTKKAAPLVYLGDQKSS
jgi:hypothetical protein